MRESSQKVYSPPFPLFCQAAPPLSPYPPTFLGAQDYSSTIQLITFEQYSSAVIVQSLCSVYEVYSVYLCSVYGVLLSSCWPRINTNIVRMKQDTFITETPSSSFTNHNPSSSSQIYLKKGKYTNTKSDKFVNLENQN